MAGEPEGGPRGPSWTTAGTVAVVLGVCFAVLITVLPADAVVTTWIDDLTQLLSAALASVLAVRAARRASGSDRRLWGWMAAGTGSWAAGQAVWSWYELALRTEPPFPSLADVGFLGFPVCAVAGLLLWRGVGHVGGTRDLIDGGLLAGALLMLSWQTALGSVLADGGSASLGFALALAYPIGDLMSATVVLLLIARSGVSSHPFVVLLAAGLVSLAVADSAFVYLVAQGEYATGNAISAGWVTGFLLIGAAATVAQGGQGQRVDRRLPAHGFFALPYVAVAVALATVLATSLGEAPLPVSQTVLAALLFALVLARQYLVLRENESLLVALEVREAALAHEVMHDGLTGLSNRAMLLLRLEQLLAGHARHGRGLVVLFCDLDDFKSINDTRGHLAGDAVLREVADRLRAVLRATDTVSRLSGDEFAVLMEPPHEDPLRVAARLITAVGEPIELPGGQVAVGVSVGIVVLAPGTLDPVESRELIAAADSAMYSAKSGGKNRAVLVEAGIALYDPPRDPRLETERR